MAAPRKYDQEFRERAVRMYRDRLEEPGESKLGARRHVGVAAGRESGDAAELGRGAEPPGQPGSGSASRSAESEEVRALKSPGGRAGAGERDPQDRRRVFRSGGARPPTQVIVAYIDSHRERFGVEPICAVLSQAGIRSRRPPTTPAAGAGDRGRARRRPTWPTRWSTCGRPTGASTGPGSCGTRPAVPGLEVGRDQVGRLMGIAGITGAIRGKHRTVTTRRDETAPRHPDLVRRGWAAPTRVDQLWVADFSYVWTLAGFVYVAFVVDVFSRRILGWRVTTSKHTGLVTDALHQALQVRRRGEHDWVAAGLIHHSDAGSQYVSVALHRRTDRRRHRRLDRHRRRRAGQRAVRVDHRAVQNRSDQRGLAGLAETVATSNGRSPAGFTGTTPAAPLLDRPPAAD